MGAKNTRDKSDSFSLNPTERRRLTVFLEKKGSRCQFSRQEMHRLWQNLLVPDLLKCYSDYVMKFDVSKKNYVGIEEFVIVYTSLVRGDATERASCLGALLGNKKNSEGVDVTSFTSLVKYMSDLLESFFLVAKDAYDANYKSWTYVKRSERKVIEQVMLGVCNDVQRKDDEITFPDLERWIQYSGLTCVLHSHVLGALYNLEPEVQATIIPLAVLPATKTQSLLDLAEVVYLNSFLPTDSKERWRFLFSTLTHGESFSKFVGCIANEGPILLVMESDDRNTFGGFISENLSVSPKWAGNDDSFLFKLYPFTEIYQSTGYNNHYAYLNMYQTSMPNGLGMGGQFSYWGLWIDSHFGTAECSESCTTYKNYKRLASKKKFRINKLEAWGVGHRPLTATEKGERTTEPQSILDKDLTSSRIMELAGRQTYSKGLRESDKPNEPS